MSQRQLLIRTPESGEINSASPLLQTDFSPSDNFPLTAEAENQIVPRSFKAVMVDQAYIFLGAATIVIIGYGVTQQAIILSEGWPNEAPKLLPDFLKAGATMLVLGGTAVMPKLLGVQHAAYRYFEMSWASLFGAISGGYFIDRVGLAGINNYYTDFGTNPNLSVSASDALFWGLFSGSMVVGGMQMGYKFVEEHFGPIRNNYLKSAGYVLNSLLYATWFHAALDQGLILADKFDPSAKAQVFRYSASTFFAICVLMASLKHPKMVSNGMSAGICGLYITEIGKVIANELQDADIDDDTRAIVATTALFTTLMMLSASAGKLTYEYRKRPHFFPPATIEELSAEEQQLAQPQHVNLHKEESEGIVPSFS